MLRNVILAYAVIVTGVYAWATWSGHQIGNDETANWNSSGPSQQHHHK